MIVSVRLELHVSIRGLPQNSSTSDLLPLFPVATLMRAEKKEKQSQASLINDYQSTGDKDGHRLREMFIELLSHPFQKMTPAPLLKEPTS